MNAEEQIRKLKEIKPLTKDEKKEKLKISIILTAATLISVLLLVYGFIQKKEADYQKEAAIKAQVEAEMNFKLAEEQRREADQQRALALQALEDCKKSK